MPNRPLLPTRPATARKGSRLSVPRLRSVSFKPSGEAVLGIGLGLLSAGFFCSAYAIFVADPQYFERRLYASLPTESVDPIVVGATQKSEASGEGGHGAATPGPEALPAETIVYDRPPVAGDYQIVTVFGDAAILTTRQTVLRVRVGSSVPGLGEILSIGQTDNGGEVKASLATLRSAAR
ncbi:hypothetical protein [Aurantimonas sp. Leaf443]|uniref:hypothetical protein n=1 Tax=Aurantimonas sp. Leaf443 TaxID=1736378 RepID=UPI000B174F18|nr:hypothetical protein [Aurantimonas sp. Leaf443]